jgi:deazaflavin-dependent oxidoreductase (nitroreductase family)
MAEGPPAFFTSPLFVPAMRVVTQTHVAIFRATGGRAGGRFRFGSAFPRGLPVCLLTTRGRKSGKARTCALLCMRDGDRVVLVASRGGTARSPQWYFNVLSQPRVLVQTRGRTERMVAREVEGDERAALWERLVAFYPEYASYQSWTERLIPVVVCEPPARPV